MRIKSVSVGNFKGLDFTHELAPVTFISGDNFAGKTAIATAIRLALAGYLPPPLGVKGIYSLAGNPDKAGSMWIHLELDNGRGVRWEWKRDSKGKVSVEGGVPPDLLMPPLLMEPKLFFAKTGAERIQAIFEACPEVGDMGVAIIKRFPEITVPTKQREALMKTFYDLVTSNKNAASALLQEVKATAKEKADEAKRLSAQVMAITLPAQAPKDSAKELKNMREELAKLSLGAELTKEKTRAKLDQIDSMLAAYSRKHKDTPTEHLLEFVEHELQTVAKDLRQLKPVPPIDELEEELEELLEEQTRITLNRHSDLTWLEPHKSRLSDLEVAQCCPVCKSNSLGWKTRAISELKAEIEQFETSYQLNLEKQALLDKRVAELLNIQKQTKTARESLIASRKELEKLAADFTSDRDNIALLLNDRAKLLSVQSKPVDEGAVAKLQNRIADLEKEMSARTVYEIGFKERERIEDALAIAQVDADAYKTLAKIITEEQSKLTEKAFGSVLKAAEAFTDGILDSNLEFVDGELGRRVSKADKERGCTAPVGSWISHEVFSDSEQRVAYAAFSIALCQKAPIKLVVIDELGTLQEDRALAFVDRLIDLQAKGVIDQAICIAPQQPLAFISRFSTRDGIKLLEL